MYVYIHVYCMCHFIYIYILCIYIYNIKYITISSSKNTARYQIPYNIQQQNTARYCKVFDARVIHAGIFVTCHKPNKANKNLAGKVMMLIYHIIPIYSKTIHILKKFFSKIV